MNDDVERVLNDLTPREAPVELRGRVLQAVAAELVVPQRSPRLLARRDVRAALAVAAALFVGVMLNVWAIRSDDARQARLHGARPLPREIHETVQMAQRAAGPACAELVRRQLVAVWQSRRRSQPPDMVRYQQQLRQLLFAEKGLIDVQEDPQVDQHRPGRTDRSALDCECDLRVA
jgi:hypothetical protein